MIKQFILAAVLVGTFGSQMAKADCVDTSTKAILDSAVAMPAATVVSDTLTTTSAPVVIQEQPACAAPVVIERRAHFLRFGLGPILDFGLL